MKTKPDNTVGTAADDKTTAKFNVTSVNCKANGTRVASLAPVTDTEVPANNALWNGAAKGKLEVTVTNKEMVDFFAPGASVYVTFTKIPDAPVDNADQSDAAPEEIGTTGARHSKKKEAGAMAPAAASV